MLRLLDALARMSRSSYRPLLAQLAEALERGAEEKAA
jgi:hypothetical protein